MIEAKIRSRSVSSFDAIERKTSLTGETNAAIQSDPALQFGIHELLAFTAHLPQAIVGLTPIFRHPHQHPVNAHPQIVGDGRDVFVVEINRIHHLAVDIQLQLAGSRIADTNRPRVSIAVQVFERVLS